MTRENYVAIKKLIIADPPQWEFIKELCDYFKTDNPNFSKVVFLKGIKVDGTSKRRAL